MKASIAVSLVLAFVGLSTVAADAAAEKLLAEAQGKWTRTMERNGNTIRMVKEIKGKKETLTVFRGDEVAYSHTVEIEVTVTKDVNLFTFRNLVVTAGPEVTQEDVADFDLPHASCVNDFQYGFVCFQKHASTQGRNESFTGASKSHCPFNVCQETC